jgi:hypothetical protein
MNDIFFNPSLLHFADIEVGKKYSLPLTLINKSLRPQRVKLVAPKSNHFILSGLLEFIKLPPGMSSSVNVIFETFQSVDKSYKDKIIILQDSYVHNLNSVIKTQEIPLLATTSCADIRYDTEVNFGEVPLNIVTGEYINFWNVGKRPGFNDVIIFIIFI